MNPKDNVIQGPWPQWGVVDFDVLNDITQLDLDYWKWEEILQDQERDAWNQFYELERQKKLIEEQTKQIKRGTKNPPHS